MNATFKLLDTVALLKDVPQYKLVVGQVGSVVELLNNNMFLVEFCNNKGETLAMVEVNSKDLLLLHYELIAA